MALQRLCNWKDGLRQSEKKAFIAAPLGMVPGHRSLLFLQGGESSYVRVEDAVNQSRDLQEGGRPGEPS